MARYSFSFYPEVSWRSFHATAKNKRALRIKAAEWLMHLLPPTLDDCFKANAEYRIKVQNWLDNDVDLGLPAKPGIERYWNLIVDGCGKFRIGCQRTNRRTA